MTDKEKIKQLAKYLELALSVIEKTDVIWMGEPAARKLLIEVRPQQ